MQALFACYLADYNVKLIKYTALLSLTYLAPPGTHITNDISAFHNERENY